MTGAGRVDRLRDGVRRKLGGKVGSKVGSKVGGKVAGAIGLDELGALEAAADSLEVAVAENRALEVPLTRLVDGLERDVAEVLSRRTGTGMGA